jgi:hypothetical protein
MDPVGSEILRTLMEQPSAISVMCTRVAALLEVDIDERLTGHVRSIVAELDELALIEPLRA